MFSHGEALRWTSIVPSPISSVYSTMTIELAPGGSMPPVEMRMVSPFLSRRLASWPISITPTSLR
jgi:hypothetical protein